MTKLYSECFKPKLEELSVKAACGLSIAQEYGIELISGTKIGADGNCAIAVWMDQINNRFPP